MTGVCLLRGATAARRLWRRVCGARLWRVCVTARARAHPLARAMCGALCKRVGGRCRREGMHPRTLSSVCTEPRRSRVDTVLRADDTRQCAGRKRRGLCLYSPRRLRPLRLCETVCRACAPQGVTLSVSSDVYRLCPVCPAASVRDGSPVVRRSPVRRGLCVGEVPRCGLLCARQFGARANALALCSRLGARRERILCARERRDGEARVAVPVTAVVRARRHGPRVRSGRVLARPAASPPWHQPRGAGARAVAAHVSACAASDLLPAQ